MLWSHNARLKKKWAMLSGATNFYFRLVFKSAYCLIWLVCMALWRLPTIQVLARRKSPLMVFKICVDHWIARRLLTWHLSQARLLVHNLSKRHVSPMNLKFVVQPLFYFFHNWSLHKAEAPQYQALSPLSPLFCLLWAELGHLICFLWLRIAWLAAACLYTVRQRSTVPPPAALCVRVLPFLCWQQCDCKQWNAAPYGAFLAYLVRKFSSLLCWQR